MSVYKRADSPFWHFDFQHRGVRFHGSTEETTRRGAEAVERQERAKVKAELRPRDPGSMSFDIAAGRYWSEVGRHKASAGEIERNLERLVAMVGATTLLGEIDDERVAALVAARRVAKRWGRAGAKARFVSPATVNRQIVQLLRPIMLRARKIWKVPLPDMPDWGAHLLREPKERVRELRVEEEMATADVEDPDFARIRQFAQITGLRLREIVGLTWPQVDFPEGTITVVGKGDKPHVVPMTAELQALLLPLRGHHPETVFTFEAKRSCFNPKAKRHYVAGERYPVTYWGVTSSRKRIFKKAGVKGFRFHDLRHTAGSRIVRETGNLKIAQNLLGHSDLRTTGRYAHAHQDDVREAMERAAARYTRAVEILSARGKTATKNPEQTPETGSGETEA